MNLRFRIQDYVYIALFACFGIFLGWAFCGLDKSRVYAEDDTPIYSTSDEFFVTIYDQGQTRTVKTAAATVGEVIERSGISLAETDLVEPGLDTVITGDYNVNIYRARPAIVIDGASRHYVMTASFDPKRIAEEAGFTIYDGDEISVEINHSFLEAGAASIYRVSRSGGRTVTVEESIPYETHTRYDYNLPKGETYLEQPGQDGRKVLIYQVNFENNVEVSRELTSEEVRSEPVAEVVVMGAAAAISPERQQCAEWARQAGVAEADLEAALDLIYHESGCRIDATNKSSGAYGIPQALPGKKMAAYGSDWETNPVTQIRWMSNYVTTRYGGWRPAMQFWWEHHWY